MLQKKDKYEQEETSRELQKAAPYLTLSWQLVITIILGAVIGYYIDRWNNTAPKYLIILMVTFTVIAFVNLIRTAVKLNKEEDMKDKNKDKDKNKNA